MLEKWQRNVIIKNIYFNIISKKLNKEFKYLQNEKTSLYINNFKKKQNWPLFLLETLGLEM